jgi:hypothetical protein
MALEKHGPEPENMHQPSARPTPTAHARFSAPRAPFTDAAMSVKTPQPYRRLGFKPQKPSFFTDAAAL